MWLLTSHTGGATDNEGLTNTLGRQPATATSHRQSGPRSTHRLKSGPRSTWGPLSGSSHRKPGPPSTQPL